MTNEQLDDLSIRTALAAGAKKKTVGRFQDITIICLGRESAGLNKMKWIAEWTVDGEPPKVYIPYAQSRDSFFEDIVPEIERQGKWQAFLIVLCEQLKKPFSAYSVLEHALKLEPHELCEAAVKVLEE